MTELEEFETIAKNRMRDIGGTEIGALYAIAVALIDLRKSLSRDTERIMSKLNLIAGNLKQ